MSKNNNNIVSPKTIVNNNKTSNSKLDEGWTIQQKSKSKRILSSSSELNSPTDRQPKPRKKIFASVNLFNALASNEDQDSNQMDGLNDNPLNDTDKNSATNTQTINTNDTPIKASPPVFVRGIEDFPELCTVLIELIGVENFVCKSSTDRLKIQTSTPDAYRSLIRFLKEERAEYHTYQLQQDKPVRVLIRNLRPSTPTSLIKSELKFRQFEVRNITNVLHKTNKHPLPLFLSIWNPATNQTIYIN